MYVTIASTIKVLSLWDAGHPSVPQGVRQWKETRRAEQDGTTYIYGLGLSDYLGYYTFVTVVDFL